MPRAVDARIRPASRRLKADHDAAEVQVEIYARLIELKPGSNERVQDWAAFINQHKQEAEATLKTEGVDIESWFSLTLNGNDYLLCYMRAESMQKAQRVAATSESPVDVYHQQFKVDAWVRGGGAVGQPLVDLSHEQVSASDSRRSYD